MPKYNLYKIIPENKEGMVQKFLGEGMTAVATKTADEWHLDFFLSDNPEGVKIGWTETYASFLGGVSPLPENLIHYGALVISKPGQCFVVSLGKTHFYLRPFCDPNFGLDLAERIVDKNNLRMKQSKIFGSQKNKVITSYQKGSAVGYDSGESMHFLRAETIDSNDWGKVTSFGHSALFSWDITPEELPTKLEKICEVLLTPPILRLPKVMMIRDEVLKRECDEILIRAILNPDEETQLEEGALFLSGVSFIFSDHYSYYFYLKNGPKEDVVSTDLSLDRLRQFITINSIDLLTHLDDVRVKVIGDTKEWSIKLREALDFVIAEGNKCLYEGKWHEFNQSYLSFLQEKVDEISLEIKGEFSGRESEFNEARQSDGYVNCDTELTMLDRKYRIEATDLYKDNALFFVKFGDVRKMNYVIDQSTAATRILRQNNKKLDIGGQERKIRKICLWLGLARRNRISKLSELNSLIFHMKLADWKREIQEAGFEPEVYVTWKTN